MFAVGIVRRLDRLGRVALPVELRGRLNIAAGDALEVFTDDDGLIILRKYKPGCRLCDEIDAPVRVSEEVFLCRSCATRLLGMLAQQYSWVGNEKGVVARPL